MINYFIIAVIFHLAWLLADGWDNYVTFMSFKGPIHKAFPIIMWLIAGGGFLALVISIIQLYS